MCDEHLCDGGLAADPGGYEEDTESGYSRRMLLRGGLIAGGLALAGGGALWRPPEALAVTSPRIYGTDEWGAAPPKEPIDILNRKPTKIIIHHTASPNSTDYSRAHAFQLARSIQQSHFNRGWKDSGQHFTISRGAYVMTGRHRSKIVLNNGTRHVLGAHCTGQNEVSVGIENEGNYMNVGLRDIHKDKLVRMCAYICQQYGILPKNIRAHREYVATLCPGDKLFNWMPTLRDRVRNQLNA